MEENNLKLVCGWGINDAKYTVSKKEEQPKVNGKRKQKFVWVCPYYRKWKSMLERCFCPKLQNKCPTYKGCTVAEEWKYLSNFIEWVDAQPNKDWVNCNLDKDFLVEGGKHYSPDTCVFIAKSLNIFITNRYRARGSCMIGSARIEVDTNRPYLAQCRNPFSKRGEKLGYYVSEHEAHLAWKTKKHEHACKLADLQPDERVANRLREMYSPETDWTNK